MPTNGQLIVHNRVGAAINFEVSPSRNALSVFASTVDKKLKAHCCVEHVLSIEASTPKLEEN